MTIIITTSWDDGNKADLKVAKILKKYGLKGTFYIPIKYEKRSLTDRHVFKLSKKFEIGSHGLRHKKLIFLNKNEKIKEIVESKKILEKIVHKKVKCFSYPYNLYDKESVEYVKNAGYVFAKNSKEFCFSTPKNPLLSSISLELSHRISRIFVPVGFGYFIKGYSWFKIAKSLYDKMPKNGIFHISGHSWQIEKNEEWNSVERLFNYITRKKFVSLSNSKISELILK